MNVGEQRKKNAADIIQPIFLLIIYNQICILLRISLDYLIHNECNFHRSAKEYFYV